MIEWFLTPKDENEKAIAYAMKLYGSNKLADTAMDHFLGSGDRDLDRKLKTLQVRSLAGQQGIDPDKFMTDDANEMSKTAQGAISYGAQKAKPKASLAHAMTSEAMFVPQKAQTVFKAALSGAGVESPGFFFKEAMRDLKALSGSATMAGRAKSIARYASFL